MIKPLGKNILLKEKKAHNQAIIMPNENNNLYEVVEQGELVEYSLVGKTVFVKEGLQFIEYQYQKYYIVDVKYLLAVCEGE